MPSRLRFFCVAPHAGAWIETFRNRYPVLSITVAPHAGAWIETNTFALPGIFVHVAPHAGAWIETLEAPIRR